MDDRTNANRKSTSDIRRERALIRDAIPAGLALVAVHAVLVLADPDGVLWWMLPLIPAAWLIVVHMRGLRRSDEYERLQQLTATAVGFATTIMLSLAGSLWVAGQAGSSPAQWLQITFIGGIVSWLVALAVVTRRAR